MGRRAGWSLLELLIVVAIVALLLTVLVPAFSSARASARLAACGAQMHDLHAALTAYAGIHEQHLPPFAFSDAAAADLPLSGHWGGAGDGDPAGFGRLGVDCVNLWALVRHGLTAPGVLVCPGASPAVARGQAGLFPHTFRASSYCVRVPTSEDLFRRAPATWERYGMGIYAVGAGGQRSPVVIQDPHGGRARETIPVVRMTERYALAAPASAGDGDYDTAADVLLADGFWRQRHEAPAPEGGGYRVEAGWCHGERFNVLAGGGGVRTVRDDGTAAANTLPPGGSLPDDGAYFATYAERVWQFFDAAP
jgi:prepilin-type N-terminal cleavage/methylation domain-containing protein